MQYTTERTRGSVSVLWLLVLACVVGGFGYSFGYATGHGQATEQADERLGRMWQFVPAGGRRDDEADQPRDASETLLPVDPAVPAPGTLGVAGSHPSGRADS